MDAATVGQLSSAVGDMCKEINHVGLVADSDVAMSLAQESASGAVAQPGETAVAVGTGYFEIQPGYAYEMQIGQRKFRVTLTQV
jgi:hypothetical protein